MNALSETGIAELLRPYGVTVNPALTGQIGVHIDLLLKWNSKIALTTVTDPVEMVRFHFGESLFAASCYRFEKSRLADVGSGPGFPGLPLAMLVPDLEVKLIESNQKKCAFLNEVCRQIGISNVSVFCGRMESLDGSPGSTFDFLTARAFGSFDELLPWAEGHLTSRGRLILWLGESDAETLSRNPAWTWDRPVPIPASQRRFLLAGWPRG
jgi:16S rRNA (guanine527-N7)-methyltransferase